MVNFDRVREPLALFCSHDDSGCIQATGDLNYKRRQDSSLSRSALILPSVVVWSLISSVLAVGVGVLVVWQRRQQRAVSEFSEQIRRLTFESGTAGRIGLEGKPE
jgi:hypothetical protein